MQVGEHRIEKRLSDLKIGEVKYQLCVGFFSFRPEIQIGDILIGDHLQIHNGLRDFGFIQFKSVDIGLLDTVPVSFFKACFGTQGRVEVVGKIAAKAVEDGFRHTPGGGVVDQRSHRH